MTLAGWHGVTSVVIGNCGFGFAPMRPDMRERAMLSMTRVEAIPYESMKAGLPWDWITYPEFLDSVERRPKAVNVLPDVVVYDFEKLECLPMEVAHDLPGGEWRRVQRARGHRAVLVNGRVTIEDDRETGTHSGLLLRHGTAPR